MYLHVLVYIEAAQAFGVAIEILAVILLMSLSPTCKTIIFCVANFVIRLIHRFISETYVAVYISSWAYASDFPVCSTGIMYSEIRTCDKERGIDNRLHICRGCVEELVILILCNDLPFLVLVFRGALCCQAYLIIAEHILVVRISRKVTG